mmetsp:Transcript_84230/g.265923  ORF Transcript_84230/g.265923 Transcript_84230/m.265923 type:complete len:209 (-) Transcript_84230:265-891(-)
MGPSSGSSKSHPRPGVPPATRGCSSPSPASRTGRTAAAAAAAAAAAGEDDPGLRRPLPADGDAEEQRHRSAVVGRPPLHHPVDERPHPEPASGGLLHERQLPPRRPAEGLQVLWHLHPSRLHGLRAHARELRAHRPAAHGRCQRVVRHPLGGPQVLHRLRRGQRHPGRLHARDLQGGGHGRQHHDVAEEGRQGHPQDEDGAPVRHRGR